MRLSTLRRVNLGVAVVIALALTTYAWTAATSWQATRVSAETQIYPRLANAFVHGDLALRVGVPPGLLRLHDPYNPETNARYRVEGIHDLTLYKGKLYSYWGPLPAVFLMPAEAVGIHVNQAWLVLAFCIGVLLASVALLREVLALSGVRRRRWMEVVAVAALAWSGVILFNLRRPAQYELALSGGVFFLVLGAWLMVRSMRPDASRRALYLASAAFGCAVLCRPSLLFAGGLLLIPLLRDRPVGGWRGVAGAVAGRWKVFLPFLGGVALFALYNYARFGSFTDFGVDRQLSGVFASEHPYGDIRYVIPGLWYYVFAPPLVRLHFPFVVLPPPPVFWGPTPKSYDEVDLVAGMALCTPVIWLTLALPWARGSRPFRRVLIGFAATAAVFVLFDSFYVWAAEMRYEMEFLALLLVVALAVWVVAGAGRNRRARLVRRWGTALIAVGVFFGLAISITGQDPSLTGESLQHTNPKAFKRLANFFSPVPTAAAVFAGRPLITALNGYSVYRPRYDELAISRPSFILGDAPMRLEVVSPNARRATLTGHVRRGPTLPPNATASMTVSVRGHELATIPVTDNTFSVNVPLGNGVNEVVLSLRAVPHPDTRATGDHLSDVEDVRIS